MIHFFIGTKAQFVKMAPVMVELERRGIAFRYIDSGQHAELTRSLRKVFGLRTLFGMRMAKAAGLRSFCIWHAFREEIIRIKFYYEKHLTLWGLRKLVSEFKIIDYTDKILRDPERFHATEMIRPGSLCQKVGLGLLRMAYWIFPSYAWLLQKDK